MSRDYMYFDCPECGGHWLWRYNDGDVFYECQGCGTTWDEDGLYEAMRCSPPNSPQSNEKGC